MSDHIALASPPKVRRAGAFSFVRRDELTATKRAPVVAGLIDPTQGNTTGTHAGAYPVCRAADERLNGHDNIVPGH